MGGGQVTEVAGGIHRIESDLGPRFVCQYALFGKERTLLVDTGLASTPAEAIGPYLEGIGSSLKAVDHVLITHADVDHCGGNRARSASGTREPSSPATSSTGAGSRRTGRC